MIDMERSKTVSVNDLVKAAEKTWDEMPFVQVMVREHFYKELVTRIALHLGLIDQVHEEKKEG